MPSRRDSNPVQLRIKIASKASSENTCQQKNLNSLRLSPSAIYFGKTLMKFVSGAARAARCPHLIAFENRTARAVPLRK